MVLDCYSTIYYLYAYILGSPDEEGGNDSSYFNYIQLQAAAPPCVKHGVVARRKPLEFAHSLVLKERGRLRRRRANITIVLLLRLLVVVYSRGCSPTCCRNRQQG